METGILNAEKLGYKFLYRYVQMRQKVDAEADSIQAISSMLALFDTCGDDSIDVDPMALAHLHQMMSKNILNILEILDDFIYIVQAKSALEKLKPSDKDEFVYISPTI